VDQKAEGAKVSAHHVEEIEVSGLALHLYNDGDEWTVWIDPQESDQTGVCCQKMY
jgi:hypothetical protein